MPKKYLLYIDILGFSNLVEKGSRNVYEIYDAINQLNVHQHDAFKTIVFSDTVLVYNRTEPSSKHDHQYLVMYAIEFAQDLLYRLIGKNVFFRATLRYGEFTHFKFSNLDAFYGTSLINSYRDEKRIPCVGLFIHKSVWSRNDIFPTAPFSKDYRFVFLNQILHSVYRELGTSLPLSVEAGELFVDLGHPWEIAKDVIFLKQIHQNMTKHPEPLVRAKFLTIWTLYRTKYPGILDGLESAKFNPKAILPNLNWTKYLKRARE